MAKASAGTQAAMDTAELDGPLQESDGETKLEVAVTVAARVLVDGRFGRCNEVVEVSAVDAEAGVQDGQLDTHPDAVAYARSLVAGDAE